MGGKDGDSGIFHKSSPASTICHIKIQKEIGQFAELKTLTEDVGPNERFI